MRAIAIDHVQLAMPAGREAEAIDFYEGLLGIPNVPKPPALAGRGGCWFEDGPEGARTIRVHLGVEADFRPARKAHPALVVDDFPALVQRLRASGVPAIDGDPPDEQVYVEDPFGNRIELVVGITLPRNPFAGADAAAEVLRAAPTVDGERLRRDIDAVADPGSTSRG
jgi:catechol 2,3-dioxygenase-like lactoylglutathione lyase family enzyme